MQHVVQDDGRWDEEGCFVYEVLHAEGLQVRNELSVGDECRIKGLNFGCGELVAVDLVQPSRVEGSTNGPFLRLSDGSGWLFENKYGVAVMRRVPCQAGLWSFFVDNINAGQGLRAHPGDHRKFVKEKTTYHPMQKIYCDRRVFQKGVSFYRVQGTKGWVFDRRSRNNKVDTMLLTHDMVKTGLFAYEALSNLAVRLFPSSCDKFRTSFVVYQGQIVVADAIRMSTKTSSQDGPFLRLSDGSGWLFEYKGQERMLEEIPIEEGTWRLQVYNKPAGIALRKQTIDSGPHYPDIYQPGAIVECDRLIRSTTGESFYKVANIPNGFVFDLRGDTQMMKLLSSQPKPPQLTNDGWEVAFVRGMAAMVDGLEEIDYNSQSRMISFRTSDGARVNVYYTTRTIGTALDHPHQGKTQMFRRDCSTSDLQDIFKNPRAHTGRGYKRRNTGSGYYAVPELSATDDDAIVQEEDLRHELVDLEKEMEKMKIKRTNMLKKIKEKHDAPREAAAKWMKKETVENIQRLQEAERQRLAEIQTQKDQQAAEERREIAERTCYRCDRVFNSIHALHQHTNSVHNFRCPYCYKEGFETEHALRQHQNALGHW